MLRPWLQVLPVFIYKWIAKMNCSVTFISASNYVQPAEDILFKIKSAEVKDK